MATGETTTIWRLRLARTVDALIVATVMFFVF